MDTTALKASMRAINPDISEGDWLFLEKHLVLKNLVRKEFLFKDGDHQGFIAFLNKGLIREYYIDDSGDENTVWFFKENVFVTDYPALLKNVPTRNHFKCIEDCELLLLPNDIILQAYRQFPTLDRFGRLIAEQILIQLQDRIEGFQFLSAEERYLKFMRDYPDLFQRVSLTQLSSFLGIQRASLSRIRKNLH